jgi:hypothetical protein
MKSRFFPAVVAVMVMGIATAGHAQQATDSLQRDRTHDERAVTRDTLKMNHDIAVRDSVRTLLQQDQARTAVTTKQIDSLQADMTRARQASPRDTAAIARDEASVKRLQAVLDKDLDRSRSEKQRLAFTEKTVQRESHAAIAAHHDVRQDHPASAQAGDSSKKRQT